MIFDLGDRTQLEFTGTDRAKFLHGFCTNDIKALTPGAGCEAFVCNIQGKVLGHIFVFCTETSLWIDSTPGQEDVLFNHLDRYLINEDVQIHRRTAEFTDLLVTGPDADDLYGRPNLSHVVVTVDGVSVQQRVVDWTGTPGWLISQPRRTAGRPPFAHPDIWNALRIEAGFPLYGIDITSGNLAQEVNRTEHCISFRKGCYLGQEPIARIDALGHVNRSLQRLTWAGDSVPAPGTPLLDVASQAQVGVMTSAARSVNSPETIAALGYVKASHATKGTRLLVAHAPDTEAAVVV